MRTFILVLVCLISYQSSASKEAAPRTDDPNLESKLRVIEAEFSQHLNAEVRITEANEVWWDSLVSVFTKTYRLRADVKKGNGTARISCRATDDVSTNTMKVATADCEWIYKTGEKKVGRLKLGDEDKVLSARPTAE